MCVLSYAFFLIDGVIFEIIYFYFLLFAFRFNFTLFIFIVLLSIIQCILFCLFIPYIYHDSLPQFQYNVVLKHLYSAFYCLIHILLLNFILISFSHNHTVVLKPPVWAERECYREVQAASHMASNYSQQALVLALTALLMLKEWVMDMGKLSTWCYLFDWFKNY